MATAIRSLDVNALQKTCSAFDQVAHLRPIRSEKDYNRMLALMNDLLDVVGDKEDHALAGLLELVGELVEDYDTNNYGKRW